MSIDANDGLRSKRDAGTPITNREKLSKLFRFLAENDTLYNIIVCDIFFQNSSPDERIDDSLRKYIAELEAKEKIIFATSTAERYARSNMMKVQPQNSGLASVDAVEDYYLKQSLYDKETRTKTLPLLMFERIHKINVSADKHGLWTYNNGGQKRRMYNSFIPEILFTRNDFDNLRSNTNYAEFDSTMAICDLGAALREPDGLNLYALLHKRSEYKKTILIGALMGKHGDVHKTLYGMLDGPIILINAYYCIYLGYNRYSFLYLVVLFTTFLFISYRIIFHKDKEIPAKTIGGFFLTKLKDRTYYLGLLLLTLVAYFFFNHTTNVAVLVIAFEFLHALVRLARNYQVIEKRETSRNSKAIPVSGVTNDLVLTPQEPNRELAAAQVQNHPE